MLGQAASYDEAIAEVPGGVTEGFYSMTPVLFVAASDTRPAVKEFAEKYKVPLRQGAEFRGADRLHRRTTRCAGPAKRGQGPVRRQFCLRNGEHQGLARHFWLAGDEFQSHAASGIE